MEILKVIGWFVFVFIVFSVLIGEYVIDRLAEIKEMEK